MTTEYEYAQYMLQRWPWTPKIGSLDEIVLEMIRRGIPFTGMRSKNLTNSLTRLRRHSVIFNHGSRSKPVWVVVQPLINSAQ